MSMMIQSEDKIYSYNVHSGIQNDGIHAGERLMSVIAQRMMTAITM